MPKFLVEIPVRVTRHKEFAVDHEATQNLAIQFENVDAEDEKEAVEFITALLLAAYWDDGDLDAPEPKVVLS